MTQKQINTIGMFKTVLEFLNMNTEKWSNDAAITEEVDAFKAAQVIIKTFQDQQEGTSTVGHTQMRDEALHTLTVLAYTLAVRLRYFARKTKNSVLNQLVDYSVSTLEAGPEETVIVRLKAILKAAKDHQAAMGDRIKPTEISEFEAAITALEPLSPKRDAVGDTHKAATGSLADTIAHAREILLSMDDAIEGYVDDEPFLEGYFSARRTSDRHARGPAKDQGDKNKPLA